jgi:hypothetical protein
MRCTSDGVGYAAVMAQASFCAFGFAADYAGASPIQRLLVLL